QFSRNNLCRIFMTATFLLYQMPDSLSTLCCLFAIGRVLIYHVVSICAIVFLKFVGKFETGHLQFLLQNKTGQTYIAALLRKPDGQKIIRFSLFFEIPMTKAAIPTFYDVTSGMLKMAKRSQSISV
ncbi:hypothetical protein, partial [Heyndrickxia faecalis]